MARRLHKKNSVSGTGAVMGQCFGSCSVHRVKLQYIAYVSHSNTDA